MSVIDDRQVSRRAVLAGSSAVGAGLAVGGLATPAAADPVPGFDEPTVYDGLPVYTYVMSAIPTLEPVSLGSGGVSVARVTRSGGMAAITYRFRIGTGADLDGTGSGAIALLGSDLDPPYRPSMPEFDIDDAGQSGWLGDGYIQRPANEETTPDHYRLEAGWTYLPCNVADRPSFPILMFVTSPGRHTTPPDFIVGVNTGGGRTPFTDTDWAAGTCLYASVLYELAADQENGDGDPCAEL